MSNNRGEALCEPPDLDEVGESLIGVCSLGSKGMKLSLSLSIGGVAGVISAFAWILLELSLENDVSTCGIALGASRASA
jgi:hypothetical protein